MKSTDSFNPHYFFYPSLYYDLCLVILYPVHFIFGDGWQVTLLTSRVLSVFFGLISLIVIYKIGIEVYNDKVGLLSMFLLSVNPLHIDHSILAKPDMLQFMFLTLSLLYCIKVAKHNIQKDYYILVLFISLCISSKWLGLLLVPLMFFSFLMTFQNSQRFRGLAYVRYLYVSLMDHKIKIKNLTLYFTIMIFTFIISNPYAIFSPGEFGLGFLRVFSGNAESGNLQGWFIGYLVYLGLSLFLLSVFALLFRLWQILGSLGKAKYKLESILVFWALFFILITTPFTRPAEHHTLLIYPSLFLISSNIIICYFESQPLKISFKMDTKNFVAIFITIVFLLSILSWTLFSLFPFYNIQSHDTRYEASDWCLENVNQDSVILSDIYAYIPPDYSNVAWNTWGLESFEIVNQSYVFDDIIVTATWQNYHPPMSIVNEIEPEYIIISSNFYSRYINNPDISPERTTFYQSLLEGNLNYTEVVRFSPSGIYNESPNYYDSGFQDLIKMAKDSSSSKGGPLIIIFEKNR